MFLAAGPMLLLVNKTPDRIPADLAVEQITLEQEAGKGHEKGHDE